MGILSNLFKPKSAGSKFEPRKIRYSTTTPASHGAETGSADKVEITEAAEAFSSTQAAGSQPLKSISFGASKTDSIFAAAPQKKNIVATKAPEPVNSTGKALSARENTLPEGPVVIGLEDVLQQIPGHLLKPDAQTDVKKELRFNASELMPGLTSGRITVPLSRLIELLPDIFENRQPSENPQIRLPLRKVVPQIGVFPLRPDQVDVQSPPLDRRYANLIVEKTEEKSEMTLPAAHTLPEPLPAPAPTEDEETVATEEAALLPEPPLIEDKVSYSLATLWPCVPKSWFVDDAQSAGDTARITLPFHLIEKQLVTGKVELAFEDFFEALPEDYKKHFSGGLEESKAGKLRIPLGEVFQNLPGVEPLPPSPKPAAVESPVENAWKIAGDAALEPEQTIPPAELNPPAEEVKKTESVGAAAIAEPSGPPAPSPATDSASVTAPAAAPPEEPISSTTAEQEPALSEPEPPAAAPAHENAEKPEEPPAPAGTAQQAGEATQQSPALQLPIYREPQEHTVQVAANIVPPRIQLQYVAPPTFFAKDAEASSPEPSVIPMPDPEPGKILAFEGVSLAFNPNAMETLFMTDGKLDPRKTAQHISHFPGIQSVIIYSGNETGIAGEIPQNFNTANTSGAASTMFQVLAGSSSQDTPAPVRDVTLRHDGFSSTWFNQGRILVGVLHPERSLEEELHRKLILVTGELSALR